MSLLRVAVPCPLHAAFTYRLEDGQSAAPGVRVRVPFGNRVVTGLVLGHEENDLALSPERIKAVVEVLDDAPLWPVAVWETWIWMASYYAHPIGDALTTTLPALLRKGASAPTPSVQASHDLSGLAKYRPGAKPVAVTPKQKEALSIICAAPDGLSRQECLDRGIASRVLEMLIGTGSIEPVIPPAERPTLTAEQLQVLAAITPTLGAFRTHLVDGVTGSGKTEIYLRLIEEVLANKRQALLLVPEISLTPQICARLQQRFGDQVGVLHSGLSDKERLETWVRAKTGTIRVLAGTRSSLFTPLPELGLVIVDEEHDTSYRQDNGLRYHARDVAMYLCSKLNIPCVLGTATPSAESYRNVRSGRMEHHVLTVRATGAPMPLMHLLDAKSMPQPDGLTPFAIEAITRTLQAGQQAMVYLPRRGYAHALYCRSCCWASECPNCSARMVYHRGRNQLICHHCTHTTRVPTECPKCAAPDLVQLGAGTERAEAALQEAVGADKVLRLDTDSVNSPDKLQQQLARVRSGEPLVILGTQIISKGHDFPGVNLTVVTGTDAALFSVDSRAKERLAQQIIQVAGRAGRARQGRVLIQTSQADNPFLRKLIESGYHCCLDELIGEYEEAGLPPVSHAALITVETNNQGEGLDFLNQVLDTAAHPDVHGPFPAVLERRAGRYRSQAMILCECRSERHRALHLVRNAATQHNPKLRLQIEIDPA
ncbi:TPA: primosomal protein N' [Pseudomonas aeruginosa]|nr:primosomal protein N' [Pseudomonas aeruginosa]